MTGRDCLDPAGKVPQAGGLAVAIVGASELAQFENLYLAYAVEARGLARAILGDADLAADALHDGFLEMLRYLMAGTRWLDPTDARAMVMRNVRWAALNLHRTRRRRREHLSPAPAEGDEDLAAWAREEARELCEQIVAGLRRSDRVVLRLHFVDGLTNPEAAARLNVSRTAFESRLRRALAAARHAARGAGFAPGVAGLVQVRHRFPRRNLATALRRTLSASRAAMQCAIAAAVMVLAIQALPGGGAWHAGGAAPMALRSVHATALVRSAVDDSISDTAFVDALTVQRAVSAVTIFGVGFGQRCGCWLIARSTDAGESWALAPAPAAPRDAELSLAAVHDDSRIVVEVRTAPGAPAEFIAADFGSSFVAAARPICAGPRATSCSFGLGRRALANRTPLPAGDHLLDFPHDGGVLCSIDRGHTWRRGCGLG